MKINLLGNNTKEHVEKKLQIVASAGALSRFDGTVTEVFESNNNYEDNLKLANLVIGLGHKSIMEHDYLVFALEDVTPIIEQIIISYRLTSFTIKSRRNVDFRNAGFYVPEFKDNNGNVLENNRELQTTYKTYMQSLFDKYSLLVDEGIPIEDCRYILPYCFYSNIIMGCDANELSRMISDMLYGKISHITEVHELGLKLLEIVKEHAPYLVKSLKKEENNANNDDKLEFLDLYEKTPKQNVPLLDKVYLTDYTRDADLKVVLSALMVRYQIDYNSAYTLLKNIMDYNPDIKKDIIRAIVNNKSQRELEQVIFTYQVPISLAVLTHLTRHRTHSLLIPEFTSFNLDNYVTPSSVAEKHLDEYTEIFKNNNVMRDFFKENGVRDEDLVYFLLSGNACNVTTTMNARTLMWISRMRCCNKAQWEIRNIANTMAYLASVNAPLIGDNLGPSCEILGYCPEGKDSCKNRGVVIKPKKIRP